MTRTGNTGEPFEYPYQLADYILAAHTWKRHTAPPTSLSQTLEHCHSIEGWTGAAFTMPAPGNLSTSAQRGHIFLRGHATQTIDWSNYNGTAPTLPTNTSKGVLVSWLRLESSFIIASTQEKDWVA